MFWKSPENAPNKWDVSDKPPRADLGVPLIAALITIAGLMMLVYANFTLPSQPPAGQPAPPQRAEQNTPGITQMQIYPSKPRQGQKPAN